MAHQNFQYTLDESLCLKDAGLVASSAAATVDSAAVYIDLGAANAYAEFDVVIDWTACEVASGNEVYTVQIEGATATAFSTVYRLITRAFGDSSVNGQPVDTTPSGRVVISCNNVAHTSATDPESTIACRYVRLYTTVSGTVATGFNYTAYLVPRKQ
jgi:hypothetical protein